MPYKDKEKERECQRAYRERNRDKLREQGRVYQRKNKESRKAYLKEYYEENRDHLLDYQRQRREMACKEEASAYQREYRKNNREGLREAQKRYREQNREKRNKMERDAYAKDPSRFLVAGSKRRAIKRNALHPDHDKSAERHMHRLAYRASRLYGERFHVDHIVPLSKGGYHHHLNLQVIPSSWNHSKNDDPYWEPPFRPKWFTIPTLEDVERGYPERVD